MSEDLSSLKHTWRNLPGGGKVFVLDNGAIIDAEAEAMIQALHSRSTGGFEAHLKTLAEKGADNFMTNFYLGYGHKSIGDCGTTTLFIEDVSMLAAKAIQDNALYSGQEASTRYIDFSQQRFIDPINIPEARELMEIQRSFYVAAQEPTRTHLRKLHPRPEGEADSKYEKAINARTFDITRSLLPAGASTNLAWHTSLRQAADKILFLRHHPLAEVREIAEGIEDALKEHHPNSFGHKRYEATERYQDLIAESYFFYDPDSPVEPRVGFWNIDMDELEKYKKLFLERPTKTELPRYLGQIGTVSADFQLDFGSFRDVQRHRAINQRMPLLTTQLGFNDWYAQNFSPEIAENLTSHLDRVRQRISDLSIDRRKTQYFTPMGYNTSNRFTGELPATIYMLELRASPSVHPTLQRVAYSIAKQIQDKLNIPLHVSDERGRFDMKRADHDIILKF